MPTPKMRPGRSRSWSAIASDSRARASPSSRSPAFRDTHASSASAPRAHHGTPTWGASAALWRTRSSAPCSSPSSRAIAPSVPVVWAPHVARALVDLIAELDQLTGPLELASPHRTDSEAVQENCPTVLVLELLPRPRRHRTRQLLGRSRELVRVGRHDVLQLAREPLECVALELANALAGDPELAADRLERHRLVAEAEAELDDPALAVRELGQRSPDGEA